MSLNRRKWLFSAVAATLTVAGAWQTVAVGAEEAPKNVVLIGWDGAHRNRVKELIAKGELPTVAELSKSGALVDIDVVTGATDTKAGWTQVLTGYAPEKSGVYNNGRYQPVPVGYSVFERLQQQLGRENIQTVAVIGKKGHVDADGPQRVPFDQWQKQQAKQKKINKAKAGLGNLQGGKIVEENGVKYVDVPGKPWFNVKDRIDLFVNGLIENEAVGKRAIEELRQRKDKRFFFFVHFAQPDHLGHKFGEASQEYSNGIKEDDLWTGKIIAALKDLKLYEKTLVYVVVDHGFNVGEFGHRYAPYVFLATNDKKVNRNGTREDIAPTVLKRFGVDLAKIEPKLDGIPLDEPAPERKAPAENPNPRPGPAKQAAAQSSSQR